MFTQAGLTKLSESQDHQDEPHMAARRHETRKGPVGRKGSWWGWVGNDEVVWLHGRDSQREGGKAMLSSFGSYTYSLFFSLTLAPFLSNSSATCFRLGCKEATAQCCKSNKIQYKTNFYLNFNSQMKQHLELLGTL